MRYIITGTSSGLGFALADRLIFYGHVVGISRSLGKAQCLNRNFTFIRYDLSNSGHNSDYSNLLDSIKTSILDDQFTLVFNAACFYSSSERLSTEPLTKLFNVNLFSAMKLVEDLQMEGLRRILFINSISGMVSQVDQHEYAASKHALMGYARSLSQSAKNSDYDVMSINPGGMDTELWQQYGYVNRSDFLNPEVVADICICLLKIPQRTFIDCMSVLPPSDI